MGTQTEILTHKADSRGRLSLRCGMIFVRRRREPCFRENSQILQNGFYTKSKSLDKRTFFLYNE